MYTDIAKSVPGLPFSHKIHMVNELDGSEGAVHFTVLFSWAFDVYALYIEW